MTDSLQKLTSLSVVSDISRNTYKTIIESGVRWDTFRRTFERKKWYEEGACIGEHFLGFAKAAETRNEYIREVLLCYNFTLQMVDKADMSEAFCNLFMQGLTDIDWKIPARELSSEELDFALHFGMINSEGVSPLFIWTQRYLANKRKRIGAGKQHLQCEEELEKRKQGIRSLVNYLRDCT